MHIPPLHADILLHAAQTTNPVNGSITLKPLSEPIAVKNNTNRLQVKSNDTLPEGMQYVAKVGEQR